MAAPTAADPAAPARDDRRFATARGTLIADRCMTWFIKGGGVLIIAAVFGIFVFILAQVTPLFRGARLAEEAAVPAAADAVAVGMDEWGQMPFVVGRDGALVFTDTAQPGAPTTSAASGLAGLSAADLDPRDLSLALGADDGRVAVGAVRYDATMVDGQRRLRPSAAFTAVAGLPAEPILAVALGGTGDERFVACLQRRADGAAAVRVAAVAAAEEAEDRPGAAASAPVAAVVDLTDRIDGHATRVLVDEHGDHLLVANDHGFVWSFAHRGDAWEPLQPPFRPFGDRGEKDVASMDWVFGDVSVAFTAPDGANRVYSLFVSPEGGRRFGRTKDFPRLPAGAACGAHSTRTKTLALGAGRALSLRFTTTESVRFERELPYAPRALAYDGKCDRLAVLGDDARLHLWSVSDPHPEGGLRAFFGKVWYEGASEPGYAWQSSSANDDAEPKLSLVPLLFGTLKGTFYALVFAVPIALLGAIYTAEFMDPRLKTWVKPTMEIMASLPSVVLGFLAAQWLAPIVETRVPSVLALVVALPAAACACGWGWARTTPAVRAKLKPGWEWAAFLPLMLVVAVGAWSLGPVLDRVLFGGDFRAWWTRSSGASFEQRNSLIVGLMMGFAVIPIIFTIAEDALTNVPKSLRSASLALGGTRWQTAIRVVVPTASAGIFSGLMIGLGRAIGETMIVVMATGNTPLMSWNPFNGMRTITATIATELPEAAEHGTLFRTLFFASLLLFLLTFVVNTVAEVLRQHLRQRYKTV